MRHSTETVTTIDLGHEQLLVFDGGREGRVRVLLGATWLTQEGETGDAILYTGAEITLGAGRTVIEGLASARVQIVEPAARRLTRPVAWLRQAWRELRQHIVRLQFGEVATRPGC